MIRIRLSIFLFALLLLLRGMLPVVAHAEELIESAPTTYVADRAGILGQGQTNYLIGMLKELEQKTGARMIVLTVDSTEGQDISQYAFERADQWTFGANGKGASVLLVVAASDRKYWFEVGYDWEGVLPDGLVGQIGREQMVPAFRAGRYGDGIIRATTVVAQTMAASKGVGLEGSVKVPRSKPTRRSRLFGFVVLVVIAIIMFGGRRTSFLRQILLWSILSSMMRGGGRYGGGGGLGGGGFGSFGGGGGGGFGGGGAGGSW